MQFKSWRKDGISSLLVSTSYFTSIRLKYSIISSMEIFVPRRALILSVSNGRDTGCFGFGYTSTAPPITSPAPSSSISWHARSIAAMAFSGSSPFSNLLEASVLSPILLEERRILVPLKQAASNNNVLISSVTMEFSPPMIPASPTSFSPSQIMSTSLSRFLSSPSRVVNLSPSLALRTMISFPAMVSKS